MTTVDIAETKPKQFEALLIIDDFVADRTFLAGNYKSEADQYLYEAICPWFVLIYSI